MGCVSPFRTRASGKPFASKPFGQTPDGPSLEKAKLVIRKHFLKFWGNIRQTLSQLSDFPFPSFPLPPSLLPLPFLPSPNVY